MRIKIDATEDMDNYIDVLSKYGLEIIEPFNKDSIIYEFTKEKQDNTYFITLNNLQELFDLVNELGKDLDVCNDCIWIHDYEEW